MLNVRTYNILKRAGVRKVGDIQPLIDSGVMLVETMKNYGRNSEAEVRALLLLADPDTWLEEWINPQYIGE
jgi:DNA-directed RNA polymerase alpha subunit